VTERAKQVFHNLYTHGFVRTAVATPRVTLSNPAENAKAIIALARKADAAGSAVVLFPELGLTGYTNDELFFQRPLLDAVREAIAAIAAASRALKTAIVVGAPLEQGGRLYNVAVAFHRGRILGVVPKAYLPNYREFYEARYFASGAGISGQTISVGGEVAPFGTDIVFAADDVPGFTFGIEICEDLWVPTPPSTYAALAGATVLLNLSASNITVGKSAVRRSLCASQAIRTISAYLYSAAGQGESTTDLSWDGQAAIFDDYGLVTDGPRFLDVDRLVMADIDVQRLTQERLRVTTWRDAQETHRALIAGYRTATFALSPDRTSDLGLERKIDRFPFVPDDPARLDEDCYEAYNIQVQALATRLKLSDIKKVVIGISGGLDSTHALIVCARAMDRLGLPRSNILAYTMPGFGTSDGTRGNAWALMEAFGVTAGEIDIKDVSQTTLRDIGHPAADGAPDYDITYENVQAGARTAYLFRLANLHDALVIGTGDLSELALGWSTYGVGDHMSHYGVNAGVPKTMIQHLISWVIAREQFGDAASGILQSILDTEITPELVPQGEAGTVQRTEDKVGPYALQDFNLFYTVRCGFAPSKIAFLAHAAWRDAAAGDWPDGIKPADRRSYDLPEIKKWLGVFLFRFFTISQFKRSALPNGPKVLSGASLSPRGDWRAPSDGNAKVWLDELAANVPNV
jgi:NAD+ synthase (glutamine-hydrolysing)